jgi:hypothetical protein
MCGKVHKDLSDAIGPIVATYAPIACRRPGCLRFFFLCVFARRNGDFSYIKQKDFRSRPQLARADHASKMLLAVLLPSATVALRAGRPAMVVGTPSLATVPGKPSAQDEAQFAADPRGFCSGLR